MSDKEREELIRSNPMYGNIVCRCETVTEGEIVESIRRPAGARNLDAVKRRTRAGMGRCQGGFCTPRLVAILARELGIPAEEVTKKGKGSKNSNGGEGVTMHNVDLAVIGGGPAGLAAALAARRNGVDNILIIERDKELGGILQQCIHNGFGLHYFGEELTGPEYAERFIEMVREENIPYKTNTMVLDIQADRTITAVNSREGLLKIRAQAVNTGNGLQGENEGEP